DDGRNARGRHRFPLYGWSSRVQESCGKISRSHRRIVNKKQPTTSRYRLTDPTPGQSSNRSICSENIKTTRRSGLQQYSKIRQHYRRIRTDRFSRSLGRRQNQRWRLAVLSSLWCWFYLGLCVDSVVSAMGIRNSDTVHPACIHCTFIAVIIN